MVAGERARREPHHDAAMPPRPCSPLSGNRQADFWARGKTIGSGPADTRPEVHFTAAGLGGPGARVLHHKDHAFRNIWASALKALDSSPRRYVSPAPDQGTPKVCRLRRRGIGPSGSATTRDILPWRSTRLLLAVVLPCNVWWRRSGWSPPPPLNTARLLFPHLVSESRRAACALAPRLSCVSCL